jgi:hypothetical protein
LEQPIGRFPFLSKAALAAVRRNRKNSYERGSDFVNMAMPNADSVV